jgi:hypothetical protein
MSVKIKLTAVYSLILLVTLAAFGFVSWALLSFGLSHNLTDSLTADFTKVRDAVMLNSGTELAVLLDEMENQIPGSPFIYDTESGELTGNPVMAEKVRGMIFDIEPRSPLVRIKNNVAEQFRLYIAPYDQESAPGKLLMISRDAGYIDSALDEYKSSLFAFIPFAMGVAAVSGYFLAYRSMRQVKVITATANKIDPADLKDRIPVRVNDELGKLSATLNSLFNRINDFIQRQHRFTTDASHDLKAPLTVIKAEADLALMRERQPEEYQAALGVVTAQVGKMRLIIDDLLTLASLDAGPRPAKSATIDIAKILKNATDNWEAAAAAKGITLTRDIQPGVEIYGEPDQFERMFDNLLSNAVKYTPPGGTVAASLKEEDGFIIATVKDSGIGIAPEHLPNIFERFYRVDRGVEGTGLGLSIVRGSAEIYRGHVEVESELGKGSTFKVVLPRKHKT